MTQGFRDRLALVRQRIAAAAVRAGRNAEDVTLIGVSKTIDARLVQQAIDAGLQTLGENKVQEAAEKVPQIRGEGLRWHLIGHLQSNKAKTAVLVFDTIHTVDSVDLVKRLDRVATEVGRRPDLLIQLNIGGETTKSGAAESEVGPIVEALDAAHSVRLVGLMAIPPLSELPEESRPYFQRLRAVLDGVNRDRPDERRLTHLSMGMSNDFEVAIEEGATMVRVGTAIFGPRHYSQ
jgi:pyridoxal phosphate enzyme (YggS family)